jgi:hypothetical protein
MKPARLTLIDARASIVASWWSDVPWAWVGTAHMQRSGGVIESSFHVPGLPLGEGPWRWAFAFLALYGAPDVDAANVDAMATVLRTEGYARSATEGLTSTFRRSRDAVRRVMTSNVWSVRAEGEVVQWPLRLFVDDEEAEVWTWKQAQEWLPKSSRAQFMYTLTQEMHALRVLPPQSWETDAHAARTLACATSVRGETSMSYSTVWCSLMQLDATTVPYYLGAAWSSHRVMREHSTMQPMLTHAPETFQHLTELSMEEQRKKEARGSRAKKGKPPKAPRGAGGKRAKKQWRKKHA